MGANSVFVLAVKDEKATVKKKPIFRDFASDKEKGSREKFRKLTKKWA